VQVAQLVALGAIWSSSFLFMKIAVPLLMWGYASQQLSVSLLSIINATAPLFGAALSLMWLREPMGTRGVAGLALGFAGVAVLVGGIALVTRGRDTATRDGVA